MYHYSQLLKQRFLSIWALIGQYKVLFRPIRTESFTFGKTSQLRLETSLVIIHKNYVLLLSALETSFFPVWALIGHYKVLFRLIGTESSIKTRN